jgi:hypothetical protein
MLSFAATWIALGHKVAVCQIPQHIPLGHVRSAPLARPPRPV